jgi:Flp pilus assembly protein TadD
MGKSNPALAVLDQVLSANGDTPEALRVRAEIMAAMGNTTDALRDRDRVHMDQAPRTRAARALALAAAREQNAAEREIGSALDEAPDNGPVLFYAAQIQILRGDNTTAADLARRAIAAEHPPLTPRQREHAQRLLDKEPG